MINGLTADLIQIGRDKKRDIARQSVSAADIQSDTPLLRQIRVNQTVMLHRLSGLSIAAADRRRILQCELAAERRETRRDLHLYEAPRLGN